MSNHDADGDLAAEVSQIRLDSQIQQVRNRAKLVAGVAGDCDLCGEWTPRLVDGACCPCRDKYKLP